VLRHLLAHVPERLERRLAQVDTVLLIDATEELIDQLDCLAGGNLDRRELAEKLWRTTAERRTNEKSGQSNARES
jgi:hypothetical protein